MILIADSGSSKTQWCLVHDGQILQELHTKGINPFYQTQEQIEDEISSTLLPKLKIESVDNVYFYGAGCSFPDKKLMLEKALRKFFCKASVSIESDMLGAARSLFQHNKGIACILGTGSNSCVYNGEEIVENVSPLGYILGDEGSGAVLGKLLVANALKNQLPLELKEKFLAKYSLSPAEILESVYKQPFPNRYLAQFTPFLVDHLDEPSLFNLVFDAFDAFFIRNVMQYELTGIQVGFVGSVAFYLRDALEIVAYERSISLASIVQSPMDGLVKYHALPPRNGAK
jgi:N-acetylglucosamine kinase-like BadF-type ATPase